MIFCFENALKAWPVHLRDAIEEVVIRLAQTDIKGRHYFILRRSEATWLLDNFTWPRHIATKIEALRNEFTSRGSLIRADRARCVMVANNSGFHRTVGQALHVGIEFLCARDFIDGRTRLVVEDIATDADVHKMSLEFSRRLLSGPPFNFEPVHSGGNRMARVFEENALQGYFVAAIADSDRLTPEGAAGSTARGLMAQSERLYDRDDCVALAAVLPCHEIENVFPRACAALYGDGQHPLVRAIEAMAEQSGDVAAEEAWAYLDLKNGFDGSIIADKVENGKLPAATLEWFCRLFSCDAGQLRGIKFQGLGPQFASQLMACGRAMSEFHKRSRDDAWSRRYARFYEDFIWFMAAPPR